MKKLFFTDTFDISKQEYYNFSGKYIMRVIAGGYSRDSMITYSTEEQHAFNIPGVSDVSLIWNVRKTTNSVQHYLAQCSNRNMYKMLAIFSGMGY